METFWLWLENANPITNVAVTILLKANKALILRRGLTAPWMPGKWNLPGGVVDGNETLIAAAIRECQEETGITPVRLTFHKKISDPSYNIHLFTAETLNEQPRLDSENDAYAWVGIEELKHYDFVPYIGQELAIILRSQKS